MKASDRGSVQVQLARILTAKGPAINASKRIFDVDPADWRDLEDKVRQIFRECDCIVLPSKGVKTVRGRVDVDVVARDETRRPHQFILCECKHWKARVPKTVVHAFRTVVADAGANLGYIISDSGFQSGAREAAANANIRLVTWKQFQAELFERWFVAMEHRLTEFCDLICDLEETGDRTLMDEAISKGGEGALSIWNALTRQYVQFSLASSKIGRGKFRAFPFRSIDPARGQSIEFTSPRLYFDIMLENAPRAFKDYATLLMHYTGGRCGTVEVLNDRTLGQIQARRSTMAEVHALLGHHHLIKVEPDGEIWTYVGAVTEFQLPQERHDASFIGSAVTHARRLTLEFGRDQLLHRKRKEDYSRPGTARV